MNSILVYLLLICGLFLIPDCFISRHVTTGLLGIAILTIVCTLIKVWQHNELKITPLSLFVFLFSLSLLLVQFFGVVLAWHDLIEYTAFMLLFFTFSQQEFDEKRLKQFYFICSLAGVGIGIWGVLQYLGIAKIYNTVEPVTGSFENPAGIGMFLAAVFPFSLFFTKEREIRWKIWGYWVSLLSVVVVVLSNSRTGVLVMTVILVSHIIQGMSARQWKRYIFTGLILGSALFLVGLYLWKKDSADGRILIWLCSLDMFGDHWFLGAGSGRFQAEYMLYQARFFQENPDSVFGMLADNVRHPFNEYLKILVEHGILGFSLFVLLVINLIKTWRCNREKIYLLPVFASLLALGGTACFSYPLDYPGIVLVLVLNLGIVNSFQIPMWVVRGKGRMNFIRGSVFFFLLVFAGVVYHWAKSEHEWCKIANASLSGKTKEMLPRYENIYKWMRRDGLFLYNYGAELFQVGEYDKSVDVLNECSVYFNDIDVQLLLAENYLRLENYEHAEVHLLLAADMCPVRFTPLYKLMKLYVKTGEEEKVVYYAKKIVEKPIKVYSDKIARMKKMAREMLR